MQNIKILFLGPADSPIIAWLERYGENVTQIENEIYPKDIEEKNFDFLISYGYRYILTKSILDSFPDSAINLHISFLPWNRGADPNFWSFVDDTPKGVTIHYLDEGVDSGDIIAQEKMEFDSPHETLSSSYAKLQSQIQELFKKNWLEIKNKKCRREKQKGAGSVHKVKDKEPLAALLTKGWDTPVSVLEEYAAARQVSQQFWGKYDSEVAEIAKTKKSD